MFPTTGSRVTATIELAGLGGNTAFYKPRFEVVRYWKQHPKLSVAVRGQVEYVAPYGNRALELPTLRAAVARRRVQRARFRHPVDRVPDADGLMLGATRACCSTRST